MKVDFLKKKVKKEDFIKERFQKIQPNPPFQNSKIWKKIEILYLGNFEQFWAIF